MRQCKSKIELMLEFEKDGKLKFVPQYGNCIEALLFMICTNSNVVSLVDV